jgi:hypothetical protein
MVKVVFFVIDMKEVKSLKDLIGYLFIGGKKKMIGVDLCSIFIEIACTNGCIALGKVILNPRDQA